MRNLLLVFLNIIWCFELYSVDRYSCKVISGKDSELLQNIWVIKMNSKNQFIGSVNSQYVAVDLENGAVFFNNYEGWNTNLIDINENGFVLGALSQKGNNVYKTIGFIWHPWTNELIFGPSDISPKAINSSNQVIGTLSSSDGYSHGSAKTFLWKPEGFSVLSTFDAQAITDNGLIVDSSLKNIIVKSIGDVSIHSVYIKDINDNGTVVGSFKINSPSMAFKYTNDSFRLLESPAFPSSYMDAISINNKEQIVGEFMSKDGKNLSCLWENGKMYPLNSLLEGNRKFDITSARQINDKGQILAIMNVDGAYLQVLLEPIKEK